MADQLFVCVVLSNVLFSVFSAVGSQYAATTVSPLNCPRPGECSLNCPQPPTCFPTIPPCQSSSTKFCPNFPNAQCVTNCQGCWAEFYVNGQNVTQQCRGDVTTVPTGSTCPRFTCPPGVPLMQCIVEPCRFATCPGNPYATCCNSYCGICSAVWYVNGVNVTSSC